MSQKTDSLRLTTADEKLLAISKLEVSLQILTIGSLP